MVVKSIQKKVLAAINSHGSGWVFTPRDLLHLGSRAAIDQALSRLTRAGTIRRIHRGVYDLPRRHPKLGVLSPSPDAVAQAFARASGARLQVSGAQAANQLGLSTQVPARVVYVSDARNKRVRLGHQLIELRRAAPRRLAASGTPAGAVLQAIRHLGPDGVTDSDIRRIAGSLQDKDRADLARHATSAPAWARPLIDRILVAG